MVGTLRGTGARSPADVYLGLRGGLLDSVPLGAHSVMAVLFPSSSRPGWLSDRVLLCNHDTSTDDGSTNCDHHGLALHSPLGARFGLLDGLSLGVHVESTKIGFPHGTTVGNGSLIGVRFRLGPRAIFDPFASPAIGNPGWLIGASLGARSWLVACCSSFSLFCTLILSFGPSKWGSVSEEVLPIRFYPDRYPRASTRAHYSARIFCRALL